MAGLLQAAITQARIWHACSRLGSLDSIERAGAMETLFRAGNASLPALRYAARSSTPRVQFAAAVVLHRLGEPTGLAVLMEALRWRLPSLSPPTALTLAAELEAALIAIGSPDAVSALLDLWWQLPTWGNPPLILTTICRVWAALRDPRALEGLVARATSIPELFESTVPAFGEMAIRPLEQMTREMVLQRRLLAIQTLRHIPGGRSFKALVPLLRDPDPLVRAAIPPALEAVGGGVATGQVVAEAMRAGYSTHIAVQTLQHYRPPDLYPTLIALVDRWDSARGESAGDTEAAVLAALPLLAQAPGPPGQIVPTLQALLDRQPGVAVQSRVAHLLGVLKSDGPSDTIARNALWPLMTHVAEEPRVEAAQALALLGDTLGRQMNQLIIDCRPQANLLNTLQAILRGGPDAGQAATQAMQQVSTWFTRISKETVERLSASATSRGASGVPKDPRLPGLLRQLLGNALEALPRTTLPEETEAVLTLCVSAIRALARVGAPDAEIARPELLQALYISKRNISPMTPGAPPFYGAERREVGEMVRAAAAETLIQWYGADSFPLFLEALYAPQSEVQGTAIVALGRLGDVRALPHLQPLAANVANSLALTAQEAIAVIRRTHPEVMTLLRASSAVDVRPDTLLRPAAATPDTVSPDHLLRPTTQFPAQPAE